MNGLGRLLKDGYDLIGLFRADHFVGEADLEAQDVPAQLKGYLMERI